jgi:hypothetical protein
MMNMKIRSRTRDFAMEGGQLADGETPREGRYETDLTGRAAWLHFQQLCLHRATAGRLRTAISALLGVASASRLSFRPQIQVFLLHLLFDGCPAFT